jgi:hypothetical protein
MFVRIYVYRNITSYTLLRPAPPWYVSVMLSGEELQQRGAQ